MANAQKFAQIKMKVYVKIVKKLKIFGYIYLLIHTALFLISDEIAAGAGIKVRLLFSVFLIIEFELPIMWVAGRRLTFIAINIIIIRA